jgi:hypothetical protein
VEIFPVARLTRNKKTSMDTTRGESDRSPRYYGNHFVNTEMARPVRMPFTSNPQELSTTAFRLLPPPCCTPDDNPDLVYEPYRYDTRRDGRGLGEWIFRGTAFTAGRDRTVFYLHDPRQFDSPEDEADARRNNPAEVLFWAAHHAIKQGHAHNPHWAPLLSGGPGYGAVLKRPNNLYIAQAIILESGTIRGEGKNAGKRQIFSPPLGLDDDPRPVIIDLGAGIGRDLVRFADTLSEEFDGDIDDESIPFEEIYANPDLTDIDNGKIVVAWPRKARDPFAAPEVVAAPARKSYSQARRDAAAPPVKADDDKDAAGFEFRVVDEWEGLPASLTDVEPTIRRLVKPLHDCLLFPTPEEQVAILANCIRFAPPKSPRDVKGFLVLDLFEYAFQEYPEYIRAIPEELWDEYRGKQSISTYVETPEPAAASPPTADPAAASPPFDSSVPSAPALPSRRSYVNPPPAAATPAAAPSAPTPVVPASLSAAMSEAMLSNNMDDAPEIDLTSVPPAVTSAPADPPSRRRTVTPPVTAPAPPVAAPAPPPAAAAAAASRRRTVTAAPAAATAETAAPAVPAAPAAPETPAAPAAPISPALQELRNRTRRTTGA